ncbi:type II toxin-antitoxin system PemK/MazF family toxin [Microcoleus sp. A006_D1]|uniref:type II toxin-antitoxin system PemK/MazF family toxin n=1 Tax=Microcoleus sp. A006_D1 TaxID=3055267 RepID=UPI003B1CD8DA
MMQITAQPTQLQLYQLPLMSPVFTMHEVLITSEDSGLSKASKVQAQQVRTISKQRIAANIVGNLNPEMMQLIDAALKLHLDLD